MNGLRRNLFLVEGIREAGFRLHHLALLVLLVWPWVTVNETQAQGMDVSPLLTGRIRDAQDQPVFDAVITAYSGEDVLAEAVSQEDGRNTLLLVAGDPIPDQISLHVERHHFSEGAYRKSG